MYCIRKTLRTTLRTKMGLMVLSTLMAPCAFAQVATEPTNPPDSSAWYFGGDIGRSKATIDNPRISDELVFDGATSVSIKDDDHDTAYKIFGGYQFNDYFAIEGGYFDLGKFSYIATTVPAGTVNGDITLKGANIDILGFLPITENLSAFGRVGANYAMARDNFSSTGLIDIINPNPRKNEANYKYGLGLQYRLTQALALRFDVERYRINDAIGNNGDIDQVSLGVVFLFGEKTQMHTASAPPPPPPAPVAPREVALVAYVPPVPPAPVAPPKPRKVSFSADSLYTFDKSDIKPEGKLAIDKFVEELKGDTYDTITVTGHSDRLGPPDYNLKLSTRRAETVKRYLVESGGIPASKIDARGVDGSDPVTRPDECVGTKATNILIACLQPDRRVDLEVTGTTK